MSRTSWNNSIFVEYNKDSKGNILPERIQNENIVVQSNACGQLAQIPYYKNKIIIDGYFEVYDQDVIEKNQFKVIYGESALIFFHPSLVGKSITIREYYGVGICLISADRIITGFDNIGNPIVQSDVNKVVKDYNNRIKPEFQGIKNKFQEIENTFEVIENDYDVIKNDYKDNIKNPWNNDLKPELERAIENYHNSTNPTWISSASWTKTITANNTNSFQLELSSFNPVGDQINKFTYQASGQEGAIDLIESEHWSRVGATITLLRGLVFNTGDKVFINVYRGIVSTLQPGTNGGDLMLGSVSLPKLSLDIQDKYNALKVRTRYKYTCTVEGAKTFDLDGNYNINDMIEIYQNNMHLFEGDEYSISGRVVTLAEGMSVGENIYCYINK